MTTSASPGELQRSLLDAYGPMMGDAVLWQALGFKTWAGFDRAIRQGKLEVRIFTLPGRRGRYALTSDVASWLWNVRATAPTPHASDGGETTTDK